MLFVYRKTLSGQRERAELSVSGGAPGQSLPQEEEGVCHEFPLLVFYSLHV